MMHSSILKGWVGRGALSLALLAGAVAVFLMMGGLGEGQEAPVEIDYPEHGSGTVVAFTALDPEKKTYPELQDVAWTLEGGGDEASFRIDPDDGRLTFKTPPDFEAPVDTGRDNVYEVTIGAKDAEAPDIARSVDDRPVTRELRIKVMNVEEPGEVTLSTLQPQEGTRITTTLIDGDGQPGESGDRTSKNLTEGAGTETEWQWSRSARATGPWRDIEDNEDTPTVMEGKTHIYEPTKGDVGMYLRATATYEDGNCDPCDIKKTARAVTANPVQADPSNKMPVFQDEKGNAIVTVTRSVAESSAAGTAVGAPVAATDPGFDGRQETLTYSLSGSDADDFDIDSGTGQIRVRAALDHETTPEYDVTVAARDPSAQVGTVDVTITVTDVDEAPTIEAETREDGRISIDYPEDRPTDEVVSTYAATDPEDTEARALKWSLSGRDAARFAISNGADDRGKLTFREAPDYEAPTDSGRDNVYNVTVEVADRGGNKTTRDVTVNVKNVDEEGLLTVSNLYPRVGTRITATLTDSDTPISNVIWTWQAGADTVSTQAAAYTPRTNDLNKTLTVKVSYTDGTGETKTFDIASRSSVRERESSVRNQSPSFLTDTPNSLTVNENEPANTPVGGELTADDEDDYNELTYSISGDVGAFSIDQDTAQITTRRELDHEKKSSYRVTVTAEDPGGARDTHSLTIQVTDVNEAVKITSGEATIYYKENGRGNVAAYRADDPEARRIAWSLGGDDAEDFEITSSGVLRFNDSPNYEDQQEYSVEVIAGDGGEGTTDTEKVTVVIVNVDEMGTVKFNQQPREDSTMTADLTDLDEVKGTASWQWARGSSRSGRFTDIEGAKNESYTPDEDDVGKYLRATATYTDGEGGGKTASRTSIASTLREESGAPKFLDPDGTPITETTRSVKENAKAETNVGAPVAARDLGNDGRQQRLTYALINDSDSGKKFDADKFSIDSRTGQIKTKTALDHEANVRDALNCITKNECKVTVTATDPGGRSAEATVNIEILDVDETPKFEGEVDTDTPPLNVASVSHAEFDEDDADTSRKSVSTYTADDQDDKDTPTKLRWSLAGNDADDFAINNMGALTFMQEPDYEAPTDSGRNNVYDVTVQATDTGDNTASKRVRVTVTNVEETGAVTFSHSQPEVGTRLTASLSDPDNARGRISWQWYRGTVPVTGMLPANITKCNIADRSPSIPCEIDEATSATYIPKVGDDGTGEDFESRLSARASYKDGKGNDDKTVAAVTVEVQGKEDNVRPEFQDGDEERTTRYDRVVNENTEFDGDGNEDEVGMPVMATDCDGAKPCQTNTDTLVYALSGTDARYFDIDSTSGQITVAQGANLDYETDNIYRVTVRATDPSNSSADVTVTITLTDVDEPPALDRKGLVAVGPDSIGHDENESGTVAQYTAVGPSADRVGWRLGGRDASDFSISGGRLTFRSTPNFESPADSDRDNIYEITVTARSGSDQDTVEVTVDVFQRRRGWEVKLSASRGVIGAPIRATLTDRDGDPTGVGWEWERSEDGVTSWTYISGTDSSSYTPTVDDAGYYLQATAYYGDPQGAGKRASAKNAGRGPGGRRRRGDAEHGAAVGGGQGDGAAVGPGRKNHEDYVAVGQVYEQGIGMVGHTRGHAVDLHGSCGGPEQLPSGHGEI